MTDTPYMPSNSSEGDVFDARWCDRCQCDAAYRVDGLASGCSILIEALCCEQPAEWVLRNGTPTCTAFVAKEGAKP